ncbi:MAG TPA: hypothetical protein VFG60_05300 [Burkholderiaceae bacterium]|nr:hypothetical protein [Burkholderiaceae bacterium]
MKTSLIPALCVAAVLTACGGSDDAAPPAVTSEVPASASQSVAGFIDYLKALVASAADTLEPVDVSAVTPPTDDTGEPRVVD